jgi:methylated-DNA-protein-cysteine methyltransferase-like protein
MNPSTPRPKPAPPPDHAAILLVIKRIPRGRVASYGQIAQLAGLPGRARLVGHMLSRLPEGSTVPWHRVINARGEIAFHPDSLAYRRQRQALESEGVAFRAARVELRLYRWQP